MKQILDDEERKLWFSKVKYFFEKPFHIKENFLLSNNWAAVPYERGSFSIELSASISKKLDLYSIEELIAIQVEEWNDKESTPWAVGTSTTVQHHLRDLAGFSPAAQRPVRRRAGTGRRAGACRRDRSGGRK